MEEPYKNREIKEMFEAHAKSDEASFIAIQKSIDEVAKDNAHRIQDLRTELVGSSGILTRIETQTTKTNGRVTVLEKANERKDGISYILTWVGIPIISILIGYLSWIGLQVTEISKTLTAYEITVEK